MTSLHSLLPPETVRRTRLANGLTVLARRDTSAPVVAIVTWVRAGYFDETDDVVGIAHVLEHMYFKGTPTLGVGEIARATKAAGGYLNAGTIYDHTHYYAVLPSSGFVRGLEVQADAYANSVIDADELARELEVIIEETKRKADTPTALAVETLFEVLHDRHRIRRWRMGREDELRALTRDRLMGFYRNHYRPSNTVIAIVGDVDPAEATAQVERLYGHLTDAPVDRAARPQETQAPGFRVREWEGDLTQAELLFGWRTPAFGHEDCAALDVLGTVLTGGRSSRLVRAARDRQLVSSVSAYNYVPTELGVFVVHAAARAPKVSQAARALWDQLRRVREGELSETEITRARCLIEASWLRRLEQADGQANFLGAWQLHGDWALGVDYHRRLFEVDAERVRDVAARWLDPDQASVVLYRPRGTPALGADPAAVRSLLDGPRPAPLDATAPPTAAPAVHGSGATLERVVDGIHVFRSAHGVPILVKRRPGASLVHLGYFTPGGVTHESASNSGITTLMTRTALRGTTRRSASRLAEDAELLGGVPSASAGTESFQWTLAVPARSLDQAAELLADLVLQPVFPDDGLEAERAVAIAAIDALRDDMYRQPMRLAAQVAWGDHPYGRVTLGNEASVRSLSRDDLARWHQARVMASASVLGVVGDVDPQAAADLLARRFAALRAAPAVEVPTSAWPLTFQEVVEERDRAQTALAILFPGPSRRDESRFDAEMISGVASGLGGRLFDQLRDKQSLAYTVLARPYTRLRSGAFAAYIATSPEKEQIAREGLLREFARFCEEDVSAEELDRAREYAIGAWQIRQGSGASVLGEMIEAWCFGALEELAHYPLDLRRVSAARMRAAARSWFDPARRIEGIVRGTAPKP